jgi:hypothetical protein
MTYRFQGRLCGFICEECQEPLANVTVRLYRPTGDDVTALAAAHPKETLAVLSERQARAKAQNLIGEAQTDASGRFTVDLDEGYEGGPFEIDVYCATVPRPRVGRHAKPLQIAVTTLQPRWRETDAGSVAAFEYCLPSRFWCGFLRQFGVWSICGSLTTCADGSPIPGAVVSAFDADWLQDDPLGSATTDGSGHFLISYTVDDFQKTPLSPLINFELIGGPDVYFKAELGGNTILAEPSSAGRQPGRENVGPCLCVSLCSDQVVGNGPETTPHWQQLEDFDIHPAPGLPGSSFSVEGYAGDPTAGAFVFGGGVRLRGNCPLQNIATNNALEYRFTIGEWTWSPPGDDPTKIPSVAPGTLAPVTQIAATLVGYVFYTDGNAMSQSEPVYVTSADATVDGWIRVDGKPVTVPMYNPPGSTAVVNVSPSNFLRTFDLLVLNSPAITTAHPAKLPGGLPKSDAGRSLTNAEKEPVRRYQIGFEVRDSVTLATVATDELSSVVLDNSPVIVALDLEELRSNACNPLAGAANAHILYTVDHPHLRNFSISIGNNNGTVHPPPAHSGSATVAMPSGAFAAGNYFFRGGAGGPHNGAGNGGVAVDISSDPSCAYAVTLSWLTRRYYDTGQSTQILYCK